MSQQPTFKDYVWAKLHRDGAPGDFLVDEEGAEVIVRYRDYLRPEGEAREDPEGVLRVDFKPDQRLEACQRILEADPHLEVTLVEWQGRHALRVKDLIEPI
jgi:hypothetical protein